MPRGGRRPGAGRQHGTGRYGEPTIVMRVPASMVDAIKQFILDYIEDYPVSEPTCPLYTQGSGVQSAGHQSMKATKGEEL